VVVVGSVADFVKLDEGAGQLDEVRRRFAEEDGDAVGDGLAAG
jgi:hypothetical protein